MENSIIVTPATADMAEGIAKLRCRYIHFAYNGFLPENAMKAIDPPLLMKQTEGWFVCRTVDVLSREGEVSAYIAFGMSDAEKIGEISEIGALASCGTHELYELVAGAIRQLQEKGAMEVRTYVLRDNLRLRFQMELFGFKRDCTTTVDNFMGTKLEKQRYVYRLS